MKPWRGPDRMRRLRHASRLSYIILITWEKMMRSNGEVFFRAKRTSISIHVGPFLSSGWPTLPKRPSNTKITKHDRNNIEQNMSKNNENPQKKKNKNIKTHNFNQQHINCSTYSTFKPRRTRSCTRPLSPAAARNGARCGCRGSGNGKRWRDPATPSRTGPRGLQIVDLMVLKWAEIPWIPSGYD